jgi:hypothetical protein
MHRAIAAVLLLALASSAMANGSMGLGLEMWDLRYWFAYVIAIVALEAWFMGRWLKVRWPHALGISVAANLATALICGVGLAAPFMHMTLVGSRLNPNPFWNGVALLSVFALPSALMEGVIWAMAFRDTRKPVFIPSMIVHAIGIPVALCILLIPERPYQGLERLTRLYRHWEMMDFKRHLEYYTLGENKIPAASDVEGLLREVPSGSASGWPEDAWAMMHYPEFGRFDVRDRRSMPFEINRRLSGRKLPFAKDGDQDQRWFVRPPKEAGPWARGLAIDVNTGQVSHMAAEDLRKLKD